MINKIKKLGNTGFVICMTLLFAGCVKDTTNTTYAGPDLVEFANPNYIAPINPIARTVATTTTPKNDSMYIQLVGPQRTAGTNVTSGSGTTFAANNAKEASENSSLGSITGDGVAAVASDSKGATLVDGKSASGTNDSTSSGSC